LSAARTTHGRASGSGGSSHRELNVWLGAPVSSAEGKALAALIPRGSPIPTDTPCGDLEPDEDESEVRPLPLGFTLCRLHLEDIDIWNLTLNLDPADLPTQWTIFTTSGMALLDERTWVEQGSPDLVVCPLAAGDLPTYVEVRWEGWSATWAVLADSRHDLPPGPGVSDLKAHQLFAALTSGKSITAAMAEELERRTEPRDPGGVVLDPLKRFDDRSTLLRRGRALSVALAHLQRRLARPVLTLESLDARLSSPLGPDFLAKKVCESVTAREQTQAEGIFTLAELTLAVGRVDWNTAFKHIDHAAAIASISATLDRLEARRADLGGDPLAIASYAVRAVKEARRCLL